jgi:hypothetical protein
MTKLHKIDREKLAEVLSMRRMDMDANEFDLLREAAENWLTITEEQPCSSKELDWVEYTRESIENAMRVSGGKFPAYKFLYCALHGVKQIKAMIAKAGE